MNTLVTLPKRRHGLSKRRNLSNLPGFSSWFDDFFDGGMGTGFLPNFNTGLTLPAVNIKENEDEFFLEIAVPGMKKSDFDINVDNKVLSISSEIKEEHEEVKDNYTRREFGYSSFKRTFTLPDSVETDKINAEYKDGILQVHLPKRDEAKQKPAKQITVS